MTWLPFVTKRMIPEGSPPVLDFVKSSDVRRKLLEELARRPRTPTELASIENKHVSHVSRALAELRVRGLVEPLSRESRERYYRVTNQGYAIYLIVSRIPK